MHIARWRTIAVTAVLLTGFAVLPAQSRAVCPVLGAGQECIDQPVVNHPTFNYTGVTFAAGSYVRVQADGCEQTGGSGATWKRYVNPDPPGGNSEYHGRVGILSSVGGAAALPNSRFIDVNGNTYRTSTPSFLQVGFEDDGYPADGSPYTDNNYSNHDNGNNNECAWSTSGPLGQFYGPDGYGGPAYILLTVTPDRAPSVAATGPSGFVTGVTTLSAAASDPDNDAYTLNYLVDGSSFTTTAATSVSWNSATVGDGNHSLTVKATDTYGAVTTSAPRTFTVDNTPPAIAINSGPDGQTFGPHSTQKWTFSAFDGTSGVNRVECRIDSAAFGPCADSGSFSAANLPGGAHTFSVRAVDNAGLASAPASRSFTIDATPPETTITGGPVDGATLVGSAAGATVAYTFSSSEPGSTFECSMQASSLRTLGVSAFASAGFAPCNGTGADTESGLQPGTYTFAVRAIDAYGNADPTPATRALIISAPPSQPLGGGGAPTTPAAPKPMAITLSYTYKASRASTRLFSLHVNGVPAGATVHVTCTGRRCPRGLTHKGYTKTRSPARLSLARFVAKPLRAGDRLRVVVTEAGYVGAVKTLSIRARKPPVVTTLCLPPGTAKPRAC